MTLPKNICALALIGLIAAGCSSRSSDEFTLQYEKLLQRMADRNYLARLDDPPDFIVTSYDAAGGNNDFNNFVRKGPDGWVVFADLKGPGYVSRFWFTGARTDKHRLRFFFDDERRPRIDTTVGEFCGGKEPFLPPLAEYVNYCWYSFVPIPFGERLVIMSQEPGKEQGAGSKLFYQINYCSLPENESVASFPRKLSDADRALIEKVRKIWALDEDPPAAEEEYATLLRKTLEPGEVSECDSIAGPGVIKTLKITPDFAAIKSVSARERILRDIILRIRWDGSDFPSVEVPLGDFFGSMWRRTRFNSMFVG
ncbi:DUF2961 domain-containing protein, partial [Verrucomicrobiota bacterium]